TTGLTGASGVAVIVPLLSIILGFDVHEAIATSLVVDVIASAVIAYTYYRHGHLRVGSGAWIALGSIGGAQLGALIAAYIPETDLGAGFGLSLIATGAIMWKRRGQGLIPQLNPDTAWALAHPLKEILAAIGLGVLIGIATGITGAGGGLMILLVLVLVLSFSMHDAIGTSTLIMAFTATSGAIGYAFQGDVNLIDGVIAGAGAAVGGVVSAIVANHIRDRTLRKVVSVFFLGLGVIMTIIYFTSSGISLIEM
ncbi:MAG: sulfite exporter TauE/SafE family protein, partial [Caldilineaceae bacterium]|nr:sulfite exporter TauE/SafE family protein [Caldilineaceae bacterium]